MALFDNVPDGVKKVILAGVGAVATGAEKSQELAGDLIKKGEQTLEQGKVLNEELTRKVKETKDGLSDEMLRSWFRGMTPEERADWLAHAQEIAEELEAEDATYEVVPEDEAAEAEAEPEPEAAEAVEEVVEAGEEAVVDEEEAPEAE